MWARVSSELGAPFAFAVFESSPPFATLVGAARCPAIEPFMRVRAHVTSRPPTPPSFTSLRRID